MSEIEVLDVQHRFDEVEQRLSIGETVSCFKNRKPIDEVDRSVWYHAM